MIAISTEDLTLSFGATPVLRGVSFAADEGDKIGVIGHNGCGKSTLFKLLTGELEPDSGSVYISKDKTVGILRQDEALAAISDQGEQTLALDIMYAAFPHLLQMEQRLARVESELSSSDAADGQAHAALVAEYTSLNERFISEGGLEFRGRCASALISMGFDEESMHRPFSTFSGGQRTRLALARELCREPDILMLDEPTNHLDLETVAYLESFLSSYKKCVLVISHDRYFLDRVTNKTLCIDNHKAKLYSGNYTKSMEQRRIDREILERHYNNQQKEIARQEAYIAQQRAWNRERNIIAAESRLKLLDKMERVEKPDSERKGMKFGFSSSIASGNDVLSLKDVRFGYAGADTLISHLSLTVKRGDRLFVVGHNGSGKSTLLKLMLGKLSPSGGYIDVGYNVTVGYYDQENQELDAHLSVLEELWRKYPTEDERYIRNILARFRFVGDDVYKSVSELSGGERARLTLAKLILSDVNLLVLDEPTNHLDIDSREALEEAISNFDGTVIAVSHDRYFLGKLATRILDLAVPRGNAPVDMQVYSSGHGYEELMRDRQRREESALSDSGGSKTAEISAQKEQYLKNKKQASDARKAQNRINRLQAEAAGIEQELDDIQKEMTGEASSDYVRLSELDNRKNALEERLLEIYEEIGI